MGTNVYMRRIPTKEERLKLIKHLHKQYEEFKATILSDTNVKPNLDAFECYGDVRKMIDSMYEEIHIGKRSGGWLFLFNKNNWKYYTHTRESIDEFIRNPNYVLVTEYGEVITPEQFWEEFYESTKEWQGHRSYWSDEEYYKVHPEDRPSWDYGHDENYGENGELRFSHYDDFS